MEKLLQMVRSLGDVPQTVRTYSKSFLQVPLTARNFVVYSLLLMVSSCLALILVVWNCVFWVIIFTALTMVNSSKSFWKAISTPLTNKQLGLIPEIKQRLLSMLTYTVQEMRSSVSLLAETVKKEKD